MMLDANLQFSNAQAVTASAASTGFYDQLAGTMGTTTFTPAPAATFGPNATYFGEDIGIGKGVGTPRVVVSIGTAFATLTSLQVQFRTAPDNVTAHASGNRSDLTFTVAMETPTVAVALLTANSRLASFDWPMRSRSATALPRFVDLNYAVTGSNATTGTITTDVTLGEDDATGTLPLYPSGFKVGA